MFTRQKAEKSWESSANIHVYNDIMIYTYITDILYIYIYIIYIYRWIDDCKTKLRMKFCLCDWMPHLCLHLESNMTVTVLGHGFLLQG